ncbi:MAG: response regulator [Holophaga sp.]|nr:response regulator [Holophaga sp.]
MSQPLILVVEDETSLLRFLVPSISTQGYQVLTAATAAQGISMARSHNPELVLLDLGLPDADGLTVLSEIRSWSRRPVIIISARHQEREKVRALDLGADDYLTKPFGAAELLARIRVALRHVAQKATPEAVFDCNGLRVDLERREVSVHGENTRLTPIEYRLLEALVRRAGRVATQQQLLSEVWGPGSEAQNHYLRIYMAQLRKKLEADPNRPAFFLTEPGVGYRLNSE